MEDIFEGIKIRILVVVYMVVIVVIELIGRLFGFDEQVNYILGNIIILSYFINTIKNKNQLIDIYHNFMVNVKWVKMIKIFIILALCIKGISLISFYAIYRIKPELLMELSDSESTSTVFSIFFFRINASFIAPIIEELMFRGVILNRLVKRWGFTIGIIVSSVIFGLAHFPNSVSFFFWSLFMCVFYIKKKNILFPIVIHLLNNLCNTIIIFLLFILGSNINNDAIKGDSSDLIIGILLTIPTMLYIIKYLKQNWPIRNK